MRRKKKHITRITSQTIPDLAQPPIVRHARDDVGQHSLLTDLSGLELQDCRAIARAEAIRLRPCFNMMAARLAHDIDRLDSILDNDPIAATPLSLGPIDRADVLEHIFNAVTRHTGNVILSKPLIAPESTLYFLEKYYNQNNAIFSYYNIKTEIDTHSYALSIMRTAATVAASVSRPMMTVDPLYMRHIAPHAPQAMYTAMQNILDFVSHDMLHHLTNVMLSQKIARRRDKAPYLEESDTLYAAYFKKQAETNQPQSYESWAVMGHARNMRFAEDVVVPRIAEQVNIFYTELSRITDKMSVATRQYFSAIPLYALCRIYPLDHPLIQSCLDRMPPPATVTPQIYNAYAKNTADAYYAAGVINPDPKTGSGHDRILLHLINALPYITVLHAPLGGELAHKVAVARDRAAAFDLRMLSTLARHI